MARQMPLPASASHVVPGPQERPLRIAIFDNLANSAYIQAKAMRRLGQAADLVLDPLDDYAMSDPRWEDLDLELPNDKLFAPSLPPADLPDWVRSEPLVENHRQGGRIERNAGLLRQAPSTWPAWSLATRRAGWRGARMVFERAWVVRTLARYDCVIAYGMGPVWAALAGVPFLAETWGGDITMLPFYDTGDWEGHESLPLPGQPSELFANARLQRLGYERASRILLTDPRFIPYGERLGQADKCVPFGFVIDTEKYAPGPEPELRTQLLDGRDGVIVFVPSRQDWYWKGSDRLLRGFAAACEGRSDAVLVCAGWGADLKRSELLIAELDIADRVRLLPHAMSKGRLRRYYRAADIVADQFTIGSYGGSSLEAMSCGRPLLISLDPDRFAGRFASFPPVANVSEPEEIAGALRRLFDDRDARAQLGEQAREWVIENHGPTLAARAIELCQEAVSEAAARRDTKMR
jgi:glycosyltransferase involved in cell wall biosynthesis